MGGGEGGVSGRRRGRGEWEEERRGVSGRGRGRGEREEEREG